MASAVLPAPAGSAWLARIAAASSASGSPAKALVDEVSISLLVESPWAPPEGRRLAPSAQQAVLIFPTAGYGNGKGVSLLNRYSLTAPGGDGTECLVSPASRP
ncbi:hypothetical protein GCM10023081_41550 [Arthrobacter ginkgonis]|uniref:Uncharacterized protein n=1 Tax=Arthrobacter ginkgonis TaxID=1630594 RepID=A0ABP7D7V0_9MICC